MKYTEYERRQIQAMMRKEMPWRKNLIFGSDGVIRWMAHCGENRTQEFDPYSILGLASSRWHCQAFFVNGEIDSVHFNLKRPVTAQVLLWRRSNVTQIIVTDQLKNEQYVIENSLPNGVQVMNLLDRLETQYSLTAEQMGELAHIVGGWSPNEWNERRWNDRFNRTKALWRRTVKYVGRFNAARTAYGIFKQHGFDPHFVGVCENE